MLRAFVIAFLATFSLGLLAQETLNNLSYGPHERNRFDLYLPKKSLVKSPLVIFIHAGGFVSGDKDSVNKYPEMIKDYNERGIAVASINYRFLDHAPLHHIMKEDIGGFVQFIRSQAKKYNLNKKLIMSMGASAGGSASLWLATHDDIADPLSNDPIKRQSSRIIAFAHINSQAGYDFIDWFDYFGKDVCFKFLKDQIWSRYHLNSVEDLYTEEGVEIREELDSLENMSKDDAPMYVYNSYGKKEVSEYDYDYFIHGPQHAILLAKRAKEVGLKYKRVIRSKGDHLPKNMMEDIRDFFLSQIRKNRTIF